MKAVEVRSYLLAQGCSEALFAVGSRGAASDAFCLVHDGRHWTVFYTERGEDSPPIYSSDSESDACAFFVRHILSLEHWHLVGSFVRESEAIAVASKVESLGAKPIRNDIPHYSRMNDPRYRVFVKSKDIFPVREAFRELPVQKA
jgi:hypothetical protein